MIHDRLFIFLEHARPGDLYDLDFAFGHLNQGLMVPLGVRSPAVEIPVSSQSLNSSTGLALVARALNRFCIV